jgi:serine/threonine-protein kinase
MSDLIGKTLGKYEIISLIGKGGMSSVYLAHQQSMERQVALKVLPPHLMSDETFLKRFQREVKTVAKMQHPRIIPVHDYGEEQGTPYIVMTYIEGGSLAQRIQKEKGLLLPEVIRLVDQIADGLDYAHRQGVIHRDFKPSNILLDTGNNAYLSDFGIARISQETVQLTGSGIVGTPTYMAPETFRQETVTPAVDIYALGVTLYQMLSGQAPYEGTTPVQLMYAHLNEPVPLLANLRADVPAAIQVVLDKAMAKNPTDRYSTAAALAADLKMAAEEDELPAFVPNPPPVMATPTRQPVATQVAPPQPVLEVPAPRSESHQERRATARRAAGGMAQRAAGGGGGWFRGCLISALVIAGILGLFVCGLGQLVSGIVNAVVAAKPAGPEVTRDLSEPLAGASALMVRIEASISGMELKSGAASNLAVDAQYHGPENGGFTSTYEIRNSTGNLVLSQSEGAPFSLPGTDQPQAAPLMGDIRVKLNDSIPLELTIASGVGDMDIDLTGLPLLDFELNAGIGTVEIHLPESGNFSMTLHGGIGSLILVLPDTLPVKIDYASGLGGIAVRNDRLVESGTQQWSTADYDTALNKVSVRINSGIGSVTIK